MRLANDCSRDNIFCLHNTVDDPLRDVSAGSFGNLYLAPHPQQNLLVSYFFDFLVGKVSDDKSHF